MTSERISALFDLSESKLRGEALRRLGHRHGVDKRVDEMAEEAMMRLFDELVERAKELMPEGDRARCPVCRGFDCRGDCRL